MAKPRDQAESSTRRPGPMGSGHGAQLGGAGRRPRLSSRRQTRRKGGRHSATRPVKKGVSASTIKSDRRDARGMAQLLRMG